MNATPAIEVAEREIQPAGRALDISPQLAAGFRSEIWLPVRPAVNSG